MLKIKDNLYMTFNEDFYPQINIPINLELVLDIKLIKIKIYGTINYIDNLQIVYDELKLFENMCYKNIKNLNSKKEININNEIYNIEDIIHKKIFSIFAPHIPIIITNKTIETNDFIFYKDKILGIKFDDFSIIPFYFLLNICSLYIKKSGFYFCLGEIEYDICEAYNEFNKIEYYLIVKNKFKIRTIKSYTYIFNIGDIIYSINNNHFNSNGRIYSEKYKMYFTLNTYLFLHDIESLDITYTPQKIKTDILEESDKYYNFKIKTIQIKLDKFDESKLKIPLTDSEKINYNNICIQIFTEKHIDKLKINNSYSDDKIVITEIDSIIYKIVKISNKKINKLSDVNDILYKKNIKAQKRTFVLKHFDTGEFIKMIL